MAALFEHWTISHRAHHENIFSTSLLHVRRCRVCLGTADARVRVRAQQEVHGAGNRSGRPGQCRRVCQRAAYGDSAGRNVRHDIRLRTSDRQPFSGEIGRPQNEEAAGRYE